MTADKIDELARTVAPYRPPSSRVEAVRSNLLVSANFIPTRPRVMTKPIALAASLMIAAAALFWLATRTESATHFAVVRSTGSASYAWPASPPDERLALADGAVSITVVPLRPHQHFRATTDDAEVEASDAAFEVAARHGDLSRVSVTRGRVILNVRGRTAITLVASETWEAGQLATVEITLPGLPTPTPTPPTPAPTATATSATPAPTARSTLTPTPAAPSAAHKSHSAFPLPAPQAPAGDRPRTTLDVEAPRTTIAPTPTAGPPETVVPGEAEFRAGWKAYRSGADREAIAQFKAARVAAGRGGLAEDASFWHAMAQARAGDVAALDSFRDFLATYPKSSRTGEASTRLGWLLLHHADLDEAERRFRAAEADVVPKVRASARDGLAAVARARK